MEANEAAETANDSNAQNENSEADTTLNDDEENVVASMPLSRAIPRKKRPRLEKKSIHDSDDDDDDDDDSIRSDKDELGSPMNVSLTQLKRQVLGRDLKVNENENDWEDEDDAEIRQIRALMNATDAGNDSDNREDSKPTATDTSETKQKNSTTITPQPLAEKLRKDLICAICHEVVYPPVAMPCGHSFCKPCIDWWLDHDNAGRCPTCRHVHGKRRSTSPNLALRACVMTLFGPEIVQRIQNRKKARPKGENGGAHDAGYQVLGKLQEETWHYVGVNREETIGVRRSIVLDAEDQRMQLALSVYGKPVKDVAEDLQERDGSNHGGTFRVELSLLSMEEDEAVDAGFPTNVVSSEDELLVCESGRFRYTHLDVQMKDDDGHLSPLARVSADDSHGRFQFVLDPSNSPGNAQTETIRTLLFEHSETGLQLEIDLSRLQKRAGGSSMAPPDRYRRNSYFYDEDSEEEMEEQNEFEEDGFLVDDDERHVEGDFSDEENASLAEDEICAICKDGGEIMICDGGDYHPGCGKSFHSTCVNRSAIPSGDWICQACAKSDGIETDIAGHEFPGAEESSDKVTDGDSIEHDATGDVVYGGTNENSDIEGVFSDDEPKDSGKQNNDDDDEAPTEQHDGEETLKRSGNGNTGGTKRRFVLEDSDSD